MSHWEIIDHTGPKGGYLRLTCDGKRVCDFFPFAVGADEKWVREQASNVVTAMNEAGEGPCHAQERNRS